MDPSVVSVLVCGPDLFALSCTATGVMSALVHLTTAEAVALRDELTRVLDAQPADVQATVTLSDADEAMERW